MTWCCSSAQGRFDSRLEYGQFLVAGPAPKPEETWFYYGFNMAHRKNWDDVLGATRTATAAIKAEGISNFKLQEFGCVHYCSTCGVNLRDHYGNDGGALRDEEYIRTMRDET